MQPNQSGHGLLRWAAVSLLVISTLVASTLARAAASFEGTTLTLPYLVYQDKLYQLELELVSTESTFDFSVKSYSERESGIAAPDNAPTLVNNVLSIPIVRVGMINYNVQLRYYPSEGLLRLLDNVEVLTNSTNDVLCFYSDTTENNQTSLTITSESEWTCSGEQRFLVANGIPDHSVGLFPNYGNPLEITAQDVSVTFPLSPVETGTVSETGVAGGAGETGYTLNGVLIAANTAGTCDDSGESCSAMGGTGDWNIEALGHSSFDFGTDDNNAHVQPGGIYHYHGMPEGLIEKLGGNSSKMTLIGWASDGFPIYARYGYNVATDANSGLRAMTGSYRYITNVPENRPSVSVYPLGVFREDWEYVAGLGDLDACNGRFGVTPEFPNGIYHYFATDTYPFLQRCVTGEVTETTTGGGSGSGSGSGGSGGTGGGSGTGSGTGGGSGMSGGGSGMSGGGSGMSGGGTGGAGSGN